MSCACDIHPCAVHAIPAGLSRLPRALGTFPHWRREVLVAVAREGALDGWRAREAGDLGLMLAEMFAYLGDVTSFYDALVADESYLGTARLPDAARRLVALLGYLPRPALGASAWLAADVDGVRTLTLPAATAFRSGEFDGNPPQVFESGAAVTLDPRVNSLPVARVPATLLPATMTSIEVASATLRVRRGQVMVLTAGSWLTAVRVGMQLSPLLRSRAAVTRIHFEPARSPPAGTPFADTQVLRSGGRCGLWKRTPASGEPAVRSGNMISLDARVGIVAGDIVVVESAGVLSARRVVEVDEQSYTLLSSLSSTITDAGGAVSTLASPAIKLGVTRLTLDENLPAVMGTVAATIVHYGFTSAGTVRPPLKDTLAQGDPISISRLFDAPRTEISALALEDRHGDAVIGGGALDAVARTATMDATPAWGRELEQQIMLRGNVLAATRGESVVDERLGAGDASKARQVFRLKKKPLTYLAAANALGRVSTLAVQVGGVRWQEVESFYGQSPDAMVFIVRHDEAGETDIIFGGAMRPPTGAAIVASYRHGAGAAGPPGGSISQVAKPVAGLRSIRNPLPAYGGADAEAPAEIAVRGPASALLLGRAISLADFETAALERSGVRAARAAWRWDARGQRPAVLLNYIGDAQLAPSIRAALRALAEEDAPIAVDVSPPQAATLEIGLTVDPKFVADAVADAVGQALFAPVTLPGTGGLLRGEQLGPDGVVFASVVVAAVMAVEGVSALQSMSMDGTPFVEIGRAPAAGGWFDFAAGIRINGRLAG